MPWILKGPFVLVKTQLYASPCARVTDLAVRQNLTSA
jgi:hypothetical protein